MLVTLSPSRIEISDNNLSVSFQGMDIVRAQVHTVSTEPTGGANTVNRRQYIRLFLSGDALQAQLATDRTAYYDIGPLEVITNQPTWLDKDTGAAAALADITPIIRATNVPPGSVSVKNSIEYDGGELQLVGDDPAPGPDYVYGTDGSGNKGWKPDPSGGSAIEGLTGDVVATGPGTVAATIQPGAVTNAKRANMAQGTLSGRASGAGTGAPQDLTPNQASTILDGATDPFLRTSALPPIPSFPDNTQVVYVSKIGNDANDGLTIDQPKLTIAAAIAVGGINYVSVLDGGTYTENLSIGSKFVSAPGATIVGTIELGASGAVIVKNHYTAADATTAVSVDNTTGYAYYICLDRLDARGVGGTFTSCDAVRNQWNSMVLHVKCPVIIGSQTAVFATNNITGHIHLDVNDIYCTGSGNVGVYADGSGGNNGRIYGKVDHIINLSGATSSIGIYCNSAGSIISLTCNEINCDTAYNVASGSLYLICPRLIGTRTGSPVLEVSDDTLSGVNTGNETTTTIGSLINSATEKTTPVDADMVGLMDSAASNILKKLSWLNIKATLKTYFDTLYQGLDATLTALAGLNSTAGLVEQTGADTFTKRAIGVAASTDILSRGDGDGRYLRSAGCHVPYVPPAGSYVIPNVNALALTTITGVADRMEIFPLIPSETFTVDTLGLEVTTSVAGSNFKLAIYADNAGLPGALIVGTGNLSGASLGVRTEAITPTQLVAGNTYWLALHASSNTAYRGIAVGGCMPIAYPAAGGTALSTQRRATGQTFGSGLPNPSPAGSLTGATIPAVMLRVA